MKRYSKEKGLAMNVRHSLKPLLTVVLLSGVTLALAAEPIDSTEALWKSLDPFYKQHIVADGLLITGSEKVSIQALREAGYLARKVLANRPDVMKDLFEKRKMYVTVMAYCELQTDLPECRRMSLWWAYRARGLGGRPVSCGEENLLNLKGDPWEGENIFIHEFAHALEGIIGARDETFSAQLKALYDKADKSGRFRGYGISNIAEFWAEGVQSWFSCNAAIRPKSGGSLSSLEIVGPEGEHVCHLRTREQMKKYMPAYAKFLDESFGQNAWVYVPVAQRLDEPHLEGFDPTDAPTFRWPAAVVEAFNRIEAEREAAKLSKLQAKVSAERLNSPATGAAARMKSWAQHVKLKEDSIFKDLKWTAVGPRIQGGKIESISCPESRKSTIYAGAGSGNLWKSENNGTTWKPVFENESTFSIAVVTACDTDPNLVWVGTGEPHMARSSFAGAGVFKSTDGAKTWKHMGLTDTHHIGRVIIDPKNPDVVYVAALGHQYTYNKERGVFKTTDGGKTWKKVLYISEKVGVVEVVMDPSDNETLYAVAWERDRKAWNNIVAGPGSGIYKSTNAGETWKLLTKGLPTGEKVGRMGIAIAPSNPKVLYIICDHRGVGGEVYRSDNKGESWRKTHEGNVKTGIGYDFCLIRVLPDNEDEIFIVGFNLLYSPDAGKTQTSISERIVPTLPYKPRRQTPHCDNHDMFIDPDDPDRIMIGTDGGLYISHDRGKVWHHVNTLPIAEFYAISVDMGEPYRIWGGTQDNGVLGGEAKPMTLGKEHWSWDHGGDNYVTIIDPNNLDTMYTEGMFGSMGRRDLKTGKRSGIRPGPAPNGERLRFNWMTPFILSPHNSKTLYAGANYVFKSENRGDKWTCISPDLSTNPGPEKRGDVPFGTITDISESELKKGLLYAGTDDGQVHVTKDDGAHWTKANKGLPDKWVTRVVASKYEAGTVFVSLTGYREDDFEKYLYMSTNFGNTWKSIAGNLPAESINVIREDPSDRDILYVGTDLGVYCSIDRGKTWQSLCNHLPTTPVHDIAVHPREGDLVIGTHGRSAFVLDTKKLKKKRERSGLRSYPK